MSTGSTHLLAWRRTTAETYARVRANPDPAAAHAGWVAERAALMSSSPVSAGPPPPVAPYDPAFRVLAELRPSPEEQIKIQTGTDGTVAFDRLGHLETPWGPLDVWWLVGYGGGVWIPVRDTARETYGGGRYLYDTVKGADLGSGPFVVDLNFLYNPSCAYDEQWACPLAPEGNRLAVPVLAGELTPHA